MKACSRAREAGGQDQGLTGFGLRRTKVLSDRHSCNGLNVGRIRLHGHDIANPSIPTLCKYPDFAIHAGIFVVLLVVVSGSARTLASLPADLHLRSGLANPVQHVTTMASRSRHFHHGHIRAKPFIDGLANDAMEAPAASCHHYLQKDGDHHC